MIRVHNGSPSDSQRLLDFFFKQPGALVPSGGHAPGIAFSRVSRRIAALRVYPAGNAPLYPNAATARAPIDY